MNFFGSSGCEWRLPLSGSCLKQPPDDPGPDEQVRRVLHEQADCPDTQRGLQSPRRPQHSNHEQGGLPAGRLRHACRIRRPLLSLL